LNVKDAELVKDYFQPYFFLKKSNKKTRILQSPLEKFGKYFLRTIQFTGPNFSNGV